MMKRVGIWPACAVVALGGLAGNACFAQAATDCSSVADDKSRLKCYDDQAHQSRKAPAAPAPTASAPASAPAQATGAARPQPKPPAAAASTKPVTPAGEFGLDPGAVRKKRAVENPELPQESDKVAARVKSVTTKAHGEYRITMDDGQVWDETQQSGKFAPEVGETVTLRRALLGSYFLDRNVGATLRVRRVQ